MVFFGNNCFFANLFLLGHKPIKIQIIQTHILSSKVLKYYSKVQKYKTSIFLIILTSNSNVTAKKKSAR